MQQRSQPAKTVSYCHRSISCIGIPNMNQQLNNLLLLLCLSVYVSCIRCDTMNAMHNLWSGFATKAAQETLKAIKKSTGAQLTLESVPMDTLQVFIGRQHHLGIEIDGLEYDLMLGSEADLAKTTQQQALPGPKDVSSSSGLVAQDWWRLRDQSLALPEVTLTGPVELVLSQQVPVGLYTPHAADVGAVRRVFLAPGATVRVSGLKAITLRRPVQLPRLPGQYLAEAYAHAKLGEAEEGFENAPGILYMSQQLRNLALNSSLNQRDLPLLSFLVEAAGPQGITLVGASIEPHELAPKLKAKKSKDGMLELSLRPGQVTTPHFDLKALTHLWAWPLPHMDMSSWVPYETLLRSILSSHPFDINAVQKRGIGLKLTKSSIKGVKLLAFEMEARSRLQLPELPADMPQIQQEETPLEIYDVVVQVHEKANGGFRYEPLSVKRKALHGNTFTMSNSAMNMALMGNRTVPLGFESHDLGIARNAP